MKNTSFQLCNEKIQPGEKASLAMPLPEFFSCAPIYMPIKVIHGKQAGPCLLVTAAMHGNELNGTEIINRLVEKINPKRVSGTIIAIPVLNVHALMNRSRYLPGGVNLDRCFPGSKTGTHAERLAKLLTEEIVSKADICIDLQTGFLNYTNLPQVYTNIEDEYSKSLAKAFNAPLISKLPLEKGMLGTWAKENNKTYLLYEAGEAMRFDEHAIKVGLKGIINILHKTEIIQLKSSKNQEDLISFVAEKNIWVRASTSGVFKSKLKLGQHIKKGQTLGMITDPFGATHTVPVVSHQEAIIVGKNNLPLVHEGEGLLQLAVFSKMEKTADDLETWNEAKKERLVEISTV